MRKQRQRLKHHAKIPLVRRNVRNVGSVEQDSAIRGVFKSGDHAQQRGLAATGWSKQANEGTVRHRQMHIVDRGECAELLGDIVQNQSGHKSPVSLVVFWRPHPSRQSNGWGRAVY